MFQASVIHGLNDVFGDQYLCSMSGNSHALRMLPTVIEEKAENYFKPMSLRNKKLNRHRNLGGATLMCVLEARHITF